MTCPVLPLLRPHSQKMTDYGFEVRSSKSKCCPLSSGRSGWLLSQCPSPMVSLSSASLQPSSRPRRLPLLETASKKQVQWIIMRAILELAFSCWDGYRFIEANSGWYLGMDNYLHLLYTRLLQLNIYCPEFCPFRPILNWECHRQLPGIIHLGRP